MYILQFRLDSEAYKGKKQTKRNDFKHSEINLTVNNLVNNKKSVRLLVLPALP